MMVIIRPASKEKFVREMVQHWKTRVSEFLEFVFAYLLVQVLELVVQYSLILD